MKKKALFLDRDGVIIKMYYHKNAGLIDTPLTVEQVEFVPGIFEFLLLAKKLGYSLILISNQPGMGINKISLRHHNEINNYITQTLQRQKINLNGQYYCLHHPYASILKYKNECTCRKPNIGLFTKASQDLNIDLKNSWVIGDGVSDVIAGYNAGCKTILIGNIYEAEYLRILEEKLGKIKPTFLVKNIRQIEKILS